jgi:tetratricopeptide (TPR) repeat protein
MSLQIEGLPAEMPEAAPRSSEVEAPPSVPPAALPVASPWSELRVRLAREGAERIEDLLRRLPPEFQTGIRDLATLSFTPEARRVFLHGLSGLLVLLLLARLVRGHGDLVVAIEYPAELRGTFTVRVRRLRWSAHRRSRVSSNADAERARRRAAAASRTVHPMVSRETRFAGLVARSYVVEIDGFLQSSGRDSVVTSHREERKVRLRRSRTLRLEFDFHPRECPVEVRVTWDARPAPEALVGLRSHPTSVRYARGSSGVRIGVPLGKHTLLVGSGDRVAERDLEITSFQPWSLTLDLADRESLLFTGCPPAVEPYLQGDVPAAARALERDGQTEVSHLVLALYHRDQDRPDLAAEHFESAGRHLEAARLRESLRDHAGSAALYEQAGDLQRAAEMYRAAGELVRAGEVYERARQFESAVECFRDARDVGRWIDALERHGSPFQAARVALEHEDWGRAIRCLEQVTAHDPHYLEAAQQLVDAYQRQGHLDLAVRKIEEVVARRGEDQAPLEACDRLAQLLEESGDTARALHVLELIRRRDATWPNLATRIEELRKRRSREEGSDSGVRTVPGGFTSEFRYEILEEVGRGGMGIVFKARDRRLGRVVALKRLPDNLRNHPKAVELFLREARSAAALNHPNIVTLFDAGQEGETYYITMELLEGHPLQRILKSRGRFGFRDAAKLGIQVANGLQYAHDQGIVHRDIKTGNLFFTKGRVIKIMDFGLAKMVEEVRRATTVIGGTPYYMAPEQSRGGAVDHRVDVYALGVTLFEFVTGAVPFGDGDVAYHHRHTPPPDPRESAADLPDAFAELILEMLAKDPEARCPSARSAADRLQEISRSLG